MCHEFNIVKKTENTSIELVLTLGDLRVIRCTEKFLYNFSAIISAVRWWFDGTLSTVFLLRHEQEPR